MADASSLAVDWAELARRNHAMLEDDARAAASAAPLLPVRSARRTRTCGLVQCWRCLQVRNRVVWFALLVYRVIYAQGYIC